MRSELDSLIDKSAYLWQSNRMDEAIKICESALEKNPNSVGILSNLGAAYWAKGQPKEALPWLLKAHQLDDKNLQVIQNIATMYQDLRDLPNALLYYEKAIALKPRDAYYRWCKGTVLLAMGEYVEGWVYYEDGLGQKDIRGLPPNFRTGQWNGNYCNRLVIWHEQGMGDTLQFVRYAKLAKQIANKVIVLCHKSLHRIIASCPYVDDVIDTIAEREFEQHISIMSLPWLFHTNMNNIPNEIPYLFADNVDVNKFKPRMSGDKLRVGLCWAGNPRKHELKLNLIDGRRSISLDMLKPILDIPNIEFYSLQKGPEAEAQLAAYTGTNIINYMNEVEDFADTAGIVFNLDLVISVDTSVVHLVGAMGKPVWVLSRYDACWRWLQNSVLNPWYPTARVFGQTEPGNWTDIIQQMAEILKTARVQR